MPPAAVRYRLGRVLAELAGGGACVQVSGAVDFEDLLQDGFCSIERAPRLHTEILTRWERRGHVDTELGAGCYSVTWRGHTFEAVQIFWIEGFERRKALWVLGQDAATTSDFVAAMLDASYVPNKSVLVFSHSCFRPDRSLFQAVLSATWEELILSSDLVERIRAEITSFLASRPLYEKYGIPYKRGILLSGPPGNGKTHCVRLLIKQAALPTLYVKSFSARYGEEEANIATVFARARQLAPCMLVLEDLDSLIKPQCLSVFLNEVDGIRADTGILTVATTNHPERLDPALLERPSRFDRKYQFGLPAPRERARYLEMWNAKLDSDLKIDAASAAIVTEKTEGMSFAFLKELILSATMRWMAEEGARPIGAVTLSELDALRATWRPIDEGDAPPVPKTPVPPFEFE